MQQNDYSPEEQKDIEERVEKAKKALEDLQLFPAASVFTVNTGNDVFATKVIAYLQDKKYTKKPVPSSFPNL